MSNPDFYINRELSLLEFTRRVMAQVKDRDTPLLERLRFLCITSSIWDEFFEIRVAGLKQQEAGGSTQRGPDNMTPAEQLREIHLKMLDLVEDQYLLFNKSLMPKLDRQGVRVLRRDEWNKKQEQWLKRFFKRELSPILSPVGLDPAHPFPKILNKSLTFIITLEGRDAFGRNSGKAVLQSPRSLPEVIRLPDSHAQSPHEFVFLSSIIHHNVGDLFPGMAIGGCYQFRVTRNSDLFVDEEEVDDLLRALEGELSSRRYGDAVRLEVDQDCPEDLVTFLTTQFELTQADVYRCPGPVDLIRLAAIPDLVERADLKFPGFTPALSEPLRSANNIFAGIQKQDVLLHHPFQSFAPVAEFVRQAAVDPKVVSIRQTLYRTGTESAIVQALINAAGNGKEVLVVIELRARFEEAANIELATAFQKAGVQVVYGVVGMKTHAKMIMVIRREGKHLRRYVHLGTGNYHARTARLYTDYGLFTNDDAICDDVQKVFQQLTTLGKAGKLKRLLQSPFTLHSSMLELIDSEASAANNNKPARIIAKMNSLIEPKIINALYEASQAGVQITLIVRGICSLRPGIKGLSENIEVRSIVGRFLEHTRVFYFLNGDDPLVYLSSADWMGRNFFNRVETCFPAEDKKIKKRIIKDLNYYVEDNCQAWIMQASGEYKRIKSGGDRISAQENLLLDLAE